MTEASVLSPFMSKLRERMPNALVIKHRDASMIGLPDFSVTYKGHVLWAEAKLYSLPKRKQMTPLDYLSKAQKESPTQAAMMQALARATMTLYFIWVKKTALYVVNPLSLECAELKGSAEGVDLVERLFAAWEEVPEPAMIF